MNRKQFFKTLFGVAGFGLYAKNIPIAKQINNNVTTDLTLSSTVLRLDSNGNIGLGTNIPSYPLNSFIIQGEFPKIS